MTTQLRTVHYGIGEIGTLILRAVVQRRDLEVAGAIDSDPDKVGRDVGDLCGIGAPLGVVVSADPAPYLAPGRADVVIHSTASRLEDVLPQLAQALEAGVNVVSTCEELSWPWARHREIAQHLDGLAKKHNVTVLGTGVNPGFVMDTLVLAHSAACQDIQSIVVTRVFDAALRRPQFQRKIGAGLTAEEFRIKVAEGSMGHVGLQESIAMIAHGLGWELDRIEESIEPAIAERSVRSDFVEVGAGRAAGMRQVARGLRHGEAVITLELAAFLGATESRDALSIRGTPNIEAEIKGGLHGDVATAAIVVNSVPFVVSARPGLITTSDLPLSFWSSSPVVHRPAAGGSF